MVATIIRRIPRNQILRDNRKGLIETYKTGIHPNPIVAEAITKVEKDAQGSGPGIANASSEIPLLLKKQRELKHRGEFEEKDSN